MEINNARGVLCAVCDKKFAGPNNASRHMLSTHADHRFTCPMCRVTFTRQDNLTRHTRSVHAPTSLLRPPQKVQENFRLKSLTHPYRKLLNIYENNVGVIPTPMLLQMVEYHKNHCITVDLEWSGISNDCYSIENMYCVNCVGYTDPDKEGEMEWQNAQLPPMQDHMLPEIGVKCTSCSTSLVSNVVYECRC